MRKIAIVLLLIFSHIAIASDDKRLQLYKEMHQPYEDCIKAIQNRRYEEELASCKSDETRDQSRCSHDAELATVKKSNEGNPFKSCDKLKPSKEEFLKRLKEIQNIT